jgi:hypothetical protein
MGRRGIVSDQNRLVLGKPMYSGGKEEDEKALTTITITMTTMPTPATTTQQQHNTTIS